MKRKFAIEMFACVQLTRSGNIYHHTKSEIAKFIPDQDN